jgi:cytochrome c-type biogenesis protein CcmH/NrfF
VKLAIWMLWSIPCLLLIGGLFAMVRMLRRGQLSSTETEPEAAQCKKMPSLLDKAGLSS